MGDGSEELAVREPARASESRGRRAEIDSIHQQKALDTPRTREACRRLGLVLEDLQFRAYDAFIIPGDLKEKQQLRFEHYEKRRKERLAQVLAERAKVIAQNAKKGEVPGVQSAQFLSMLESLFEKEAKRLEMDLKGQLRQHSSLVQENEKQLDSESKLQEKLILREQRRLHANQVINETGQKIKQNNDQRLGKNNETISRLEEEFKKKQEEFAREVLAEEERLQRFVDQKGQLSSDKSAVFKEKMGKMKEKNAQMVMERQLEGENRLQDIESRILQVSARREEEQRMRMVRSEEQHLHIMDVRDTKHRIERVDGYRRVELREQIDSNIERIETLLALKDQLLDQRKGRNLKAEATKCSRGLNLRRDCIPGPGQYEAPPSSLDGCGIKIGKAHVPGMLDEAVKATRDNPAPGSYDTNLMPNGDRVDQTNGEAGKFGSRQRTSFLDEIRKEKEFVPPPGRYELKTQLDHRATKMARERINEQGEDKFSAKRYPVWARPGTDTPGPAGYNVDDYMRKEVLRRAQRSLPSLTRDMLRPGKTNVA